MASRCIVSILWVSTTSSREHFVSATNHCHVFLALKNLHSYKPPFVPERRSSALLRAPTPSLEGKQFTGLGNTRGESTPNHRYIYPTSPHLMRNQCRENEASGWYLAQVTYIPSFPFDVKQAESLAASCCEGFATSRGTFSFTRALIDIIRDLNEQPEYDGFPCNKSCGLPRANSRDSTVLFQVRGRGILLAMIASVALRSQIKPSKWRGRPNSARVNAKLPRPALHPQVKKRQPRWQPQPSTLSHRT